jgi:hypothetical protein
MSGEGENKISNMTTKKFYWATQKQIPKLNYPFPSNRITGSVDMNLVKKMLL